MKNTLIELISIVESLATKIDGREFAVLSTEYYPPKIEFHRIGTHGESIRLMEMKTDLLAPPTRGERIDSLNDGFQEEKIRLLEEKVKLLEAILNKHYNIDIIQ